MDFGTCPPSGHRCDGAPDNAVEPVIGAVAGVGLPLVGHAAAGLRLHALLGREVVGEEQMLLPPSAEEPQAAGITHLHRQVRTDRIVIAARSSCRFLRFDVRSRRA